LFGLANAPVGRGVLVADAAGPEDVQEVCPRRRAATDRHQEQEHQPAAFHGPPPFHTSARGYHFSVRRPRAARRTAACPSPLFAKKRRGWRRRRIAGSGVPVKRCVRFGRRQGRATWRRVATPRGQRFPAARVAFRSPYPRLGTHVADRLTPGSRSRCAPPWPSCLLDRAVGRRGPALAAGRDPVRVECRVRGHPRAAGAAGAARAEGQAGG
jgi:hypothetical protein